ncbi:MAG TPA: hypothetical protein VFY25_01780, partial [Anaerolineales bacterium]|nr:hypothetical protein [Anaerolineales bacterium]
MERTEKGAILNTQANPYVGPRTFRKDEGHLFFGRDREAQDLSALIASDQLVLFYAQSGAGKSSLINTRIIPELENKLYEVLPVARVSGNWPEGGKSRNVYSYNLMRSFIRREIQPESLFDLTLTQFLAKLNEDEQGYFYDDTLGMDIRVQTEDFIPWRRALIIDQFEELFSTNPESWKKREDFFNQLSQAMQDDPYMWVVLIMREDYIAALDPYAHLMPGGLRTRYYMERLRREGAIKAVRKPVEAIRPYEPGVAEKLVEDLSKIKIQRPDGSQDLQSGQYVEPVQLQVVCYSLWDHLPSEGTAITEQDLLEVGDVDEALGKYYASRISGVAHAKNVKERLIREWVEKKLIAAGGIRSMVLQETGRKSGGLADDVIQALQSDLVRAENRGGTFWYELTHDRLVGPILADNKKWFDVNLSPVQRQASLWNDQERNESWLLSDQALVEVEEWAKANPDELTELENEFLEASRKQQAQLEERRAMQQRELEIANQLAEEQSRSAQRLRRFIGAVGVLALIAVLGAVAAAVFGVRAQAANAAANNSLNVAQTAQAEAVSQAQAAGTAQAIAEQEKARAEAAANAALAGSLVAQADSLKNTNYPLALLLGIEAYERNPNLLSRSTLFKLLQFTPYEQRFDFGGAIVSVAVSPDGHVIAVASSNEIALFDADLDPITKITEGLGVVQSLAFRQDDAGLLLATGGCVVAGCSESKGLITFWQIADQGATPIHQQPVHSFLVKAVAFSPDGNTLVTGSYDQTVILWDISSLTNPVMLGNPIQAHLSFVNGVAFAPDGGTIISAGDDRKILVWDIARSSEVTLLGSPSQGHNAPISAIAFSPDGTKFASASNDNSVILWDWNANSRALQIHLRLLGHTGFVKSVAFNEDGSILASAGFDNR